MARVVLTQPAPRVEGIAERLRGRGHEPLALPLSRIVDRHDDAVRAAMADLARYDWIVLVSPAAVASAARLAGVHWPGAASVAVIGPGSVQAIVERGLPIDPARVLHPPGPRYDADALLDMAPLRAPRGLAVLVLRGEGGSEHWIARLRAGGAEVRTCEVYAREPIEPPAGALAALAQRLRGVPLPVFVFTQVEAVGRVGELLVRHRLSAAAHRAPALAIHPRIAAALRRAGWTDVQLIEPGETALASALESPRPIEQQPQ